MESKIAKAIGTRHNPVAILLADEKPADALQFISTGLAARPGD